MNVSVVIPTKDRLRFLKKAIPMYLSHKEVAEVVIVIDGSTDGTLEYLIAASKKNRKIKYIDNEINRGIPYSRNIGIKAATSEYVFSSEDDLEITNNFFEILLKHLKNNNADIISGRNIFRYEDEDASEAILRTNKFTGDYVNRKTIDVQTGMRLQDDSEELMIASPMLAKRTVFMDVMFDEMYKVNFWREETDFQISAQEKGYMLLSCPHAICFNYIILNDRSGVHAAVGLKRAKWIIINNWNFIHKHRHFIDNNFRIGLPLIYIIKFSIKRVFTEAIVPVASIIKSKLLRS